VIDTLRRPAPAVVTDAEFDAMVDSLGDVGAVLKGANPERLEQLYQALPASGGVRADPRGPLRPNGT
jgi:hypothetical protein